MAENKPRKDVTDMDWVQVDASDGVENGLEEDWQSKPQPQSQSEQHRILAEESVMASTFGLLKEYFGKLLNIQPKGSGRRNGKMGI